MTRVLVLVALLAALLAPAVAAGYGTTTTYVSGLAGTPPGTWAGLAAAQDAADGGATATLTETDAGGTPVLNAAERTFTAGAGGWTSSVNSVLLVCTAAAGWDGGAGAPAGSLGTSFLTLVAYGGTTCNGTWTSPTFAWTGATPASASFSLDRRVDANGLLGAVELRWTARLVDVTAGTVHPMATALETADTGWGTVTGTADPAWLVNGHTYRIEIVTVLELAPLLLSTVGVGYDNVVLSAVPAAFAADGEMTIGGVPPGSTHTLEIRATATGEDFILDVWNGAGWDPLATVTTGGWTTLSQGLTAGQWNAGTVRLRARDAAGGDGAASVLGVDYARVVSTGGVTVSGPATITLDPVTLTGTGTVQSTTATGPFEVIDTGGAASGWSLRMTLGDLVAPGPRILPAGAVTLAPRPPTTPDGSDMTGLAAGAGGALDPVTPVVAMTAAPGGGVGTYRQSPDMTVSVPANGYAGLYAGVLQVTVS